MTYPAVLTSSSPFVDVVCTRIALLLEVHDRSHRNASLGMVDPATGRNRAHNTLVRMLGAASSKDSRAPRLHQVDEFLQALGLGADAMDRPVLGPDDPGFLRWIGDGPDGRRTAEEAAAEYGRSAELLRRMVFQGLVVVLPDGSMELSAAGRDALLREVPTTGVRSGKRTVRPEHGADGPGTPATT